MDNFTKVLQERFLGNSIENYLWFAGILLAGILLKRLISKVFSRILFAFFGKKTKAVGVGQFLELLTAPLSLLVLLITIHLAAQRLEFPENWHMAPESSLGLKMVLSRLYKVAIALCITWIVLRMADFIARVFLHRASLTESKMDDQLVIFTREISKVIIAVTGLFAAVAVGFELQVVSLITGLGIGGLAFALAAKETLENLLGSFTIFLDKPFKVGDQIRLGDIDGIVEGVGIRTTRIRALDRSLVVIPNKKMIDAELVNENERTLRRVRFRIGLTYNTTTEQLQKITADIRGLLESHPLVHEQVRVHFYSFSDSSLDILIVYFVMDPAYEKFLQVNEDINLKIMDIVARNGSSFAFPSTSVYMEKNGRDEPLLVTVPTQGT